MSRIKIINGKAVVSQNDEVKTLVYIDNDQIEMMNETERKAWEMEMREELCGGLLIAETEEGDAYEPIAAVSTFGEAIEIAQSDWSHRTDFDLCPYCYAVWERGPTGRMRKVAEYNL